MTDVKRCPFCGREVYYRMTTSGVMFFNCIHCNASITFSRTGEEMSPEEAKRGLTIGLLIGQMVGDNK